MGRLHCQPIIICIDGRYGPIADKANCTAVEGERRLCFGLISCVVSCAEGLLC